MNGSSSTGPATELSPAERLRHQHEVDATHQPTMQEVEDEEDILHPPPSQHLSAPQQTPLKTASNITTTGDTMSAKAMGKQKESNGMAPAVAQQPSAKPQQQPPSLDPMSEKSFPSLGSGRKTPLSATPSMAWGSRKSSLVNVHEQTNGGGSSNTNTNGYTSSPGLPSSGASTPTSGIRSPSLAATLPTRSAVPFPQPMALPGKHSERIQFAPSQIMPRNQLKKPIQESVRDINRRSKAKIEMRTGPSGAVIFEGRGPLDAVRQALKNLAKEVGSKQQVQIPVPISVRPHIIGRQGAVIQGIQSRTGARVQLPRTEDDTLKHLGNDDDGTTVDVSIEGDAVAAELARREIEAIIAERTSSVNLRLRDIPAEFLPFLAGPRNSRTKTYEGGRPIQVQIPQYHTWSDRAPPPMVAEGMLPQFGPSPNTHVKISGDRLAAMEARAEIEREVEALRQRLTLSQVPIDKGRHQFILNDENSLHEFLEETGCALVLPPPTHETEILTVIGPPEQIDLGIDRVVDLASAMQMSRIDIAKQHAHAPLGSQAHARALTQYLEQRRVIEHLERQHSAKIVLPSSDNPGSSADWEVYVRDGKNGIRAKQDILGFVAAHPPARVRHVAVDPFYHQHVHRQAAGPLREQFGTVLLPPRPQTSPEHLVLIYEGPVENASSANNNGNPVGNATTQTQGKPLPPRQPPSPQDLSDFERNLHLAQQHLLEMIAGQGELGTAPVQAPPKYHDKVRKFVGRQQRELPRQQIPVQVFFGPAPSATTNGVVHDGLAMPNGSSTAVAQEEGYLRGPASAVHALAAQVVEFIAAEKRDEAERGLVTSFDFPQKHMSHLIGKKGENINKYRDEFDVDIQAKEGKIDIIGPRAKAELARAKIVALGKQLDDESTHILKINPKYHREIIGAKGSQVNRLQDRYNVRIQFPRAAGGDEQRADDASDDTTGAPPANAKQRRAQAPDEVVIKGPSKGADAVREEMLSFLQWTIDHSNTASISVAAKQLPQLIGSGGQELENLRLTTGAQIDVASRDSADAQGRVQVTLKGTKQQVADAKKILEGKSKAYDSTVTRTVEVDQQYHKSLIGAGGANIRDIVVAAGGSDDRRELARMVRFPRPDTGEQSIQVEGTKPVVDKIVAALEAFASQRQGEITEYVAVSKDKHRLLIGRGGESRKKLEADCGVAVNIPKATDEGPDGEKVRVVGQPANIARAKLAIAAMVQENVGETVLVPRKYHHSISNNGQFFRRLRSEHRVTVDHGDQKPPPKPSASGAAASQLSRAQVNGSLAAMPLITDQDSAGDGGASSHSFQLIPHDTLPAPTPAPSSTEAVEDEGTIPWILKGKPDDIAQARPLLDAALAKAVARSTSAPNTFSTTTSPPDAPQATGLLVLPDPGTYKFVIGQGGNKINEIRRATGCQITVPRDQTPGAAIEIVGSKSGVEEAREMILEAVEGRSGRS